MTPELQKQYADKWVEFCKIMEFYPENKPEHFKLDLDGRVMLEQVFREGLEEKVNNCLRTIAVVNDVVRQVAEQPPSRPRSILERFVRPIEESLKSVRLYLKDPIPAKRPSPWADLMKLPLFSEIVTKAEWDACSRQDRSIMHQCDILSKKYNESPKNAYKNLKKHWDHHSVLLLAWGNIAYVPGGSIERYYEAFQVVWDVLHESDDPDIKAYVQLCAEI